MAPLLEQSIYTYKNERQEVKQVLSRGRYQRKREDKWRR
jgi:hypothetical protein